MKQYAHYLFFCCLLGMTACSSAEPFQTTQTPSPSQTPVPMEIISPGPEWMLVWADEFDLPTGDETKGVEQHLNDLQERQRGEVNELLNELSNLY